MKQFPSRMLIETWMNDSSLENLVADDMPRKKISRLSPAGTSTSSHQVEDDSSLKNLVAVDMPRKKIPGLSPAGTSTSSRQVEDANAASSSNQLCENNFSIQDPRSRDQPSTVIRQKVKDALNMFRELSDQFLKEYDAEKCGRMNAKRKVQIEAAMFLRKKHEWINSSKRLGPVPGIEVGDKFYGLHHQFSSGIDFMKIDGNLVATSIVASNRYANRRSNNSLIYMGQGGNPMVFGVKPKDQKLKGGNLALQNSMNAKTPVRVIFKLSSSNMNCITYVYDGLYQVDKMTQGRGEFGKLVFKFFLNRISGQPESLTPGKKNKSESKIHIAQKDVVCVNDIPQGQEEIPIRVVTSRNDGRKLPLFDYIVKIEYPNWFEQSMLPGCDCIGNCLDNEKCLCAIKNGGRIPYDLNRKLVADGRKSLIYECGPSCNCSASCINRVSQCGIQFKLEIFETDSKGWVVRTRSFIPSGRFVCEYIGEFISGKEAEQRLVADGYAIEFGAGKSFIDATRRGNVARFINHSCSIFVLKMFCMMIRGSSTKCCLL